MRRRFGGRPPYTQPVLKALFHPLDELDVAIDNVCHQAGWVIVIKLPILWRSLSS